MNAARDTLHYQILGQLLDTVPVEIFSGGGRPIETQRWLGQAAAVIEEVGSITDASAFAVALSLLSGTTAYRNANHMVALLSKALAQLEMRLPAGAGGTFIPAASPFEALNAVKIAVEKAEKDILFVDPYADMKLLTDFALAVPVGVTIRILADSDPRRLQASLRAASHRWIDQYRSARPLEVRLTPAKALHDRLILVDHTHAWQAGQSFKDLAQKSPSSVSRLPADVAAMKLETYADFWESATQQS